MKFGIPGIRDLNNSLLAMRNESWQYLIAFGMVMMLAILFAGSILLNIYHITLLAISSDHEISTIHQYQGKAKIDTVIPEAANVNDWRLFGSPPPVVTTIAGGNFTLIGIEYSYYDPSKAKAIISNNSGEEGIYQVNEKLPQGAIIEKIEPQKVTFLFNGALVVLTLKWDDEHPAHNPVLNSTIPSDFRKMLNRGPNEQ